MTNQTDYIRLTQLQAQLREIHEEQRDTADEGLQAKFASAEASLGSLIDGLLNELVEVPVEPVKPSYKAKVFVTPERRKEIVDVPFERRAS